MGTVSASRRLLRFGVFQVDLLAGELRKNGQKTKLQEQPFQVLGMLLERPGEVVTREQLRQRIWGADTFVDFDQSLNKAINKIRSALGDSADSPRFVETVGRRGYRFISAVEGTLPSSPDAGVAQRRWPWILAATLALLAGLAATLEVLRWRERLRWKAGSANIQSVAVLPLENLSRDPEQEYLADGMTDALITDLAKLGALRVISRTSVMQYKGTRKPLPQIARELKVDAVVEGTVQRSGERVRITAQLIHGPTDRHLWADSYERERRDLLALQAELARAIAEEIRIKLSPQERARLGRAHPVRPEAHDAYLKGRYFWNKRNREGLEKAVEYFHQALARDPNYGPAYAGLADCYLLGYLWGIPGGEAIVKAREAARKAIELDETLAEAHTSLARARPGADFDWGAREREFRRAIELNPNYATAHQWYGEHLTRLGQFEEGLKEIRRAVELDPLSLAVNTVLGWHFFMARRYDQAVEQLQKTLEMDPNFALAHFELGQAYERKGMHKQAIAELRKAVELSGKTPLFLGALGHAYAVSGNRREAAGALDELKREWKRTGSEPYAIAWIYVGLGEKEQALAWLEKAYQARGVGVWNLKVDPKFDPLRSNSRFQDLLSRLALSR